MLSLIYNTISNAIGVGVSINLNSNQLIENVEKLQKLQKEVANEQLRDAHLPEKDVEETKCFRRTGFVTKLDATHGVIDNTFCFSIEKAAAVQAELQTGDKVKYTATKDSEDAAIRIVRILCVENDNWGERITDEQIQKEVEQLREVPPEYFRTENRAFLATVLHKNGGILVLNDSDKTQVDLDLVKADFVPIVGDRLTLEAVVEKSDNFVDGAGEKVDVTAISYDRLKKDKGSISKVDIGHRCGVINGKFFFYFDVLDEDYQMPRLNDAVIFMAISSDQPGGYVWRCIQVALQSSNRDRDQPYNVEPVRRINDNVDTRNKNGIEIPDLLRVTLSECGQSKVLKFVVSNNGTQRHKILRSIFKNKNQNHCILRVPTSYESIILEAGQEFEYQIEVKAHFFGRFTEIFTIHFDGDFGIERFIAIDVMDETQPIPSVGPTVNNYKYGNRNKSHTLNIWNKQRDAIPGQRTAPKANFVFCKFDSYHVPANLKTAVLEMSTTDEVNENLMLITPFQDKLSIRTYKKYMDYLLYLEEIQTFHNMRRYDKDRAHFLKEGEYLSLHMLNIAEARPSIVVGDSIKAFCPWSEDERPEEGIIHRVSNDKIFLKFSQCFHDRYDGSDYRIEFHFSRSSLRKQHHAVSAVVAKMGEHFLFPSKIQTNPSLQLDVELVDGKLECTDKLTGKKTELKWYNKNLNIIQKEAIKNILRGEARPMPYIVFGPPGTGKTVTIIEAILQLSINVTDSRILVATPSNSAADLITEHIIDSNKFMAGHFVRLVGHNAIEREMIPQHLLKYCSTIDIARPGTTKDEMHVTKSGLKLRCNADVLGRHRITIGTCNTIGTLMQLQFPKDHFTHAIIDESGQCIEPEAVIPVTFLSKLTGQVIFAGDPMQLGPVVLSRHAINNGLETSFLVRLLQRFPYLKDAERFAMGYDPRLVTKLLYCYRSLPSILRTFSELSYNNELRAVISETDSPESDLLQKLDDILPNKGSRTAHHGVFFVGLRGENQRDSDSPSWYNHEEAKNISMFVIKLYRTGLVPDDIGVITPYQKQVRYIRMLMTSFDIVPPKIGTVEEFQGQERNIILVSTVRSSRKLLTEHDIKLQIGFVKSIKRTNVAISRARALLIVFGNPNLLVHDANWRWLLLYCVKNGTYTGVELPNCLAEDD